MKYTKQTWRDGLTVLSAHHLEHIEDGIAYLYDNLGAGDSVYYANVSTAIADINNGATTNSLSGAEDAKVKVFVADNGRLTVLLMADVSESTLIAVNKDIDLVLGGHTLSFTSIEASLLFGAATSCIINGEANGSRVVKTVDSSGLSEESMGSCRMIYTKGNKLSVYGGEYHVDGSWGKSMSAFYLAPTGGALELSGCRVHVTNLSDVTYPTTQGEASGTRCVMADGDGLVLRDTVCECKTLAMDCVTCDVLGVGSVLIDQCDISSTVVGNAQKCYSIKFKHSKTLTMRKTKVRSVTPGRFASCLLVNGAEGDSDGVAIIEDSDLYVNHENTDNDSESYCVMGSRTNTIRMHNTKGEIRCKGYRHRAAHFQYTNSVNLEGCELYLIDANNAFSGTCQGICCGQSVKMLKVKDTLVYTDAPGSDSSQTSSVGIYVDVSAEACIVENTKVYATHSAITNWSNLYVRGCLLSGWSHGGLYMLHDSTKVAIIKDTQLWNAFYDGEFSADDLWEGGLASNCYFGYAWYLNSDGAPVPGGDSYIDGCTFGWEGSPVVTACCVRDTEAGDTPNRLFISNSEFIGGHTQFRARGEDGKTPAEVYIGVGCSFGASDVHVDETKPAEGQGKIEETNALYRKHYPGEELTAEDYGAITQLLSSFLDVTEELF